MKNNKEKDEKMKRTYLARIRENDGEGYRAFVYAKNIEEAKEINNVEGIDYRVTPKEKAELMENYGITYFERD